MTQGTIIVLNGASSSGKTTLLKILQEVLDPPYLNAGIDKFLWMLPGRYLERPLWDDVLGLATVAGKTGQTLMTGMHQAIAALSRSGNNILADHVLVEPAWVRQCAKLFYKMPAYLIGIHCPLEVLEQRERDRTDRTLGQAWAQFNLVHAHQFYDLEVDTSQLTPLECAFSIKQHVDKRIPPVAWMRLKEAGRRQGDYQPGG